MQRHPATPTTRPSVPARSAERRLALSLSRDYQATGFSGV
jgi:hypothetical protein